MYCTLMNLLKKILAFLCVNWMRIVRLRMRNTILSLLLSRSIAIYFIWSNILLNV